MRVEQGDYEMDKNDTYTPGYGTAVYDGKTYQLTQDAYPTSRVLNEYGTELQYQGDGDSYMDEWAASAIGPDGETVKVRWHFLFPRKGGPEDADMLDWDNVHDIIPVE